MTDNTQQHEKNINKKPLSLQVEDLMKHVQALFSQLKHGIMVMQKLSERLGDNRQTLIPN